MRGSIICQPLDEHGKEEGTPILAINDGVLSNVGWNTLGGRRFWLTDRYGNMFYFAHLSGFSPLAKDGAQVFALFALANLYIARGGLAST